MKIAFKKYLDFFVHLFRFRIFNIWLFYTSSSQERLIFCSYFFCFLLWRSYDFLLAAIDAKMTFNKVLRD